jgi:hypothetical protein
MKNIFRISFAAFTIFAFACNSGPKPETAAESFINAMNKQDFETARKFCTEETFKLIDFLTSLADMAKQEGAAFADAEPVSNVKCTVDGDKAKCSFCCDGDGKETEVDLVKVNNEWKVNIEFEGFGDMDMESMLDTSYIMETDSGTVIEDIEEEESAQ